MENFEERNDSSNLIFRIFVFAPFPPRMELESKKRSYIHPLIHLSRLIHVTSPWNIYDGREGLRDI